ncbi:unnamed protein product [Prunus armeniaca]|uniref:Uncharacterized protein n=1 Tax=Prunus armeniaca TaxID=36596 RepID=A0A6J5UFU8_PRUAR|nr:unnamed protein product [Prunus armeniaca]
MNKRLFSGVAFSLARRALHLSRVFFVHVQLLSSLIVFTSVVCRRPIAACVGPVRWRRLGIVLRALCPNVKLLSSFFLESTVGVLVFFIGLCVVPLDSMAFMHSRILGVGHDFRQLGLLVELYVPLSTGSVVLGLWDSGGDRDFIVVEQFICIDEFIAKVMEANLEGSPNSPRCVHMNVYGLGI